MRDPVEQNFEFMAAGMDLQRGHVRSQVRRIRSLRSRILVGSAASTAVLAGYSTPGAAVTSPMLEAFTQQRLARIRYTDLNGAITHRDIEPQYLYLNVPVWYALMWDHLRGAVSFFHLDRIATVTAVPQQFRLRPAAIYVDTGEPEARTL